MEKMASLWLCKSTKAKRHSPNKWGRVTMNRDVKMCPMGSTALCLLHRFEVTHKEFDFSGNSRLFGSKLIVSLDKTSSLDKEMSGSFYGKMLQKTCGELDVTTDTLQHFGQTYGALYVELQDITIDQIENIIKWSTSQLEEAYWTKLPMKALRVMDGHEEMKGSYFLARGAFIPLEELQKQIFPFADAALI
jgi:hypothetical protein